MNYHYSVEKLVANVYNKVCPLSLYIHRLYSLRFDEKLYSKNGTNIIIYIYCSNVCEKGPTIKMLEYGDQGENKRGQITKRTNKHTANNNKPTVFFTFYFILTCSIFFLLVHPMYFAPFTLNALRQFKAVWYCLGFMKIIYIHYTYIYYKSIFNADEII